MLIRLMLPSNYTLTFDIIVSKNIVLKFSFGIKHNDDDKSNGTSLNMKCTQLSSKNHLLDYRSDSGL